jgi:hypothetical protein
MDFSSMPTINVPGLPGYVDNSSGGYDIPSPTIDSPVTVTGHVDGIPDRVTGPTGGPPTNTTNRTTGNGQKEIPDWSKMTDEQIEAALKGMVQSMTDSRGTAGYDDAIRSGNAELKRRQEAAKKQAQQDALDKAVNKDKENQEMVKKATEGLSGLWNRLKNNLVGDYNNDGVVDNKDIAEKFKQNTSKPVIDDTKPGTLTPEIVNPTNNGQNVTTRTQLDNEVKNGSSDPFENPQGFYEETKDNSEWFGDPQPEQTQPENVPTGPTNVQPPKEEQPKEEQPKETETPWQYTGNTGGSVFRGNPYTIGSGSYFNDDNTVNTNTQSWFDSKDFSYFDEPDNKGEQ